MSRRDSRATVSRNKFTTHVQHYTIRICTVHTQHTQLTYIHELYTGHSWAAVTGGQTPLRRDILIRLVTPFGRCLFTCRDVYIMYMYIHIVSCMCMCTPPTARSPTFRYFTAIGAYYRYSTCTRLFVMLYRHMQHDDLLRSVLRGNENISIKSHASRKMFRNNIQFYHCENRIYFMPL